MVFVSPKVGERLLVENYYGTSHLYFFFSFFGNTSHLDFKHTVESKKKMKNIACATLFYLVRILKHAYPF